AVSGPAARGLARLRFRRGRHPAGFVQQPMSARRPTPPAARSARHRLRAIDFGPHVVLRGLFGTTLNSLQISKLLGYEPRMRTPHLASLVYRRHSSELD